MQNTQPSKLDQQQRLLETFKKKQSVLGTQFEKFLNRIKTDNSDTYQNLVSGTVDISKIPEISVFFRDAYQTYDTTLKNSLITLATEILQLEKQIWESKQRINREEKAHAKKTQKTQLLKASTHELQNENNSINIESLAQHYTEELKKINAQINLFNQRTKKLQADNSHHSDQENAIAAKISALIASSNADKDKLTTTLKQGGAAKATIETKFHELSAINTKIAANINTKASLEAKLQVLQQDLEKINQATSSASNELQLAGADLTAVTKIQSKAQADIQRQIDDCNDKLATASAEKTQLEQQKISVEEALHKAQKQLAEHIATTDELVVKITQQTQQIKKQRDNLLELRTKNTKQQQKNTKELQTELTRLEAEISQAMSAANSRKTELSSKLDTLKARIDILPFTGLPEDEILALKQQAEDLKKSIQNKNSTLASVSTDAEPLLRQVQLVSTELAQNQAQEQEQGKETKNIEERFDAESALTEIAKLKDTSSASSDKTVEEKPIMLKPPESMADRVIADLENAKTKAIVESLTSKISDLQDENKGIDTDALSKHQFEQNALFQHTITGIEEKKAALQHENTRALQQEQKISSDISVLQANSAENENTLKTTLKQAQTAKATIEANSKELSAINARIGASATTMSSLESIMKSLQEDLEEINHKAETKANELRQADANPEAIIKIRSDAQKDIEQQIADCGAKLRAASEEKAQLEQQKKNLEQALQEKREQLGQHTTAAKRLVSEINKQNQDITEQRNKLLELRAKNTQQQQEKIKELQTELETLEQEIRKSTKATVTAKSQLFDKLSALESKLDALPLNMLSADSSETVEIQQQVREIKDSISAKRATLNSIPIRTDHLLEQTKQISTDLTQTQPQEPAPDVADIAAKFDVNAKLAQIAELETTLSAPIVTVTEKTTSVIPEPPKSLANPVIEQLKTAQANAMLQLLSKNITTLAQTSQDIDTNAFFAQHSALTEKFEHAITAIKQKKATLQNENLRALDQENAISSKISALKSDVITNKSALKYNLDEANRLRATIETMSRKLYSINTQIAANSNTLSSLSSKIRILQADLERITQAAALAVSALDAAGTDANTTEIATIRLEALQQTQAKIAEYEGNLAKAIEEKKLLEQQRTGITQELQGAHEQLDKHTTAAKDLVAKITNQTSQIQQQQAELLKIKAENAKRQQANTAELKSELNTLELEISKSIDTTVTGKSQLFDKLSALEAKLQALPFSMLSADSSETVKLQQQIQEIKDSIAAKKATLDSIPTSTDHLLEQTKQISTDLTQIQPQEPTQDVAHFAMDFDSRDTLAKITELEKFSTSSTGIPTEDKQEEPPVMLQPNESIADDAIERINAAKETALAAHVKTASTTKYNANIAKLKEIRAQLILLKTWTEKPFTSISPIPSATYTSQPYLADPIAFSGDYRNMILGVYAALEYLYKIKKSGPTAETKFNALAEKFLELLAINPLTTEENAKLFMTKFDECVEVGFKRRNRLPNFINVILNWLARNLFAILLPETPMYMLYAREDKNFFSTEEMKKLPHYPQPTSATYFIHQLALMKYHPATDQEEKTAQQHKQTLTGDCQNKLSSLSNINTKITEMRTLLAVLQQITSQNYDLSKSIDSLVTQTATLSLLIKKFPPGDENSVDSTHQTILTQYNQLIANYNTCCKLLTTATKETATQLDNKASLLRAENSEITKQLGHSAEYLSRKGSSQLYPPL